MMFTGRESARCGGDATSDKDASGASPQLGAYGAAELRAGDSDAGRGANPGSGERAPEEGPEVSDICDGDGDGDCGTDLTNLTWLTELRCQRSLTWPPNVDGEDDCFEEQSDEDAAGPPEKRLKALGGAKGGVGPPEPAGEEGDAESGGANAAAKDSRCKNAKRALQYAPPKRKQQSPGKADSAEAGAPNAPTKRPTPAERYEMFLEKVKRDLDEYEQYAAAYQSDVNEKPPFNYSHIIGMSMLQNGRVTLQQICSWIESKFAYFRVRKKWNNSIRHNLSLHHCFRKINRNKYEKGKGGYWELGLDPKKCDRKRIRNRKSTKAKAKGSAPPEPASLAIERLLQPPGGDRDPPAQLFLADGGQHASQMATATDAPACPLLGSGGMAVSPNAAALGCGDLQPQHYQLGTIIISTLSADANGAHHDFQSIEDEANQHIAYLPIIVNSANPALPDGIDGDCISLEPSDSLTLPIEHEPPQQADPSVLVEQSDPRNACYMIAGPALSSGIVPSAANPSPTHCDYANIISDNFRPYIDGIEEAFQYLRSMDNNREDILDNLLDISVSDY